MTIAVNTHVVAMQTDQKKIFLMKVTDINKGILSGYLVRDSHLIQQRKSVEIPAKQVLAILGEEPAPGKVFGCDTAQVYRGKKTHINFGSLYWFYKPEKEIGERVMRAYDSCWKILKKNQLEFTVEPSTCIWEIYPFQGEKWAGLYKRSRDPEKNPHRLRFRPECMTPEFYNYVIMHELAHHIHSEFATGRKLNANWLRMYNSSIKVKDIPKEKSMELLEAMMAQEDLPSDFKGQLDELDTIAFKWVLKSIKQNHKLSIKELDLLFEAEYRDDIREVWPENVAASDLEPVVSEYACINVRELFAEAVSLHLTGTKLPKNVVALVEKTLSYAKANHEK